MKLTALFPAAAIGLFTIFGAPSAAQSARFDALLADTTPAPGEHFGECVAIDGDRAVVGAPQASDVLANAGEAHVFERSPDGTWSHVAKLVASTPQAQNAFGRSVAIDGDVIVCSSLHLGRLWVFERDANGAWSETAVLPAPLGHNAANGLDVEGARIVSAFRGSPQFAIEGGIDVWEKVGGVWQHVQAVVAPGGLDSDFGRRLRLAGERVVTGSPLLADQSGRVFVFERFAGSWQYVTQLFNPTAQIGDGLGYSVAIDGDRLYAGALGRDLGAENSGGVAVFESDPVFAWRFVGEIAASAPQTNGYFGSALDAHDGLLAIGAGAHDGAATDSGAVFVVNVDANGTWRHSALITDEDATTGALLGSWHGDSVAVDAGRCVIGARGAHAGGGLAAVFEHTRLFADTHAVGLAAGGVQHLHLRGEPALAGSVHLVLGSFAGTSPGVPLAPNVLLPLVPDAYTNLGLVFATPVAGALGVLDADGWSEATFVVHAGAPASFAGLTLHHAWLSIDLGTFAVATSNAVPVHLVP